MFETSLGDLTAANVSTDSPLTGTGRGKAAWPYLVRIAPGGKVCADARDKVSFASSTGDRAAPALFEDNDKKIGGGPNLTGSLLTRIKVTVKVTVIYPPGGIFSNGNAPRGCSAK